MRTFRRLPHITILVGALVLAASPADAQEARREPITDPAVLMSWGLAPDTKDVFRLVTSRPDAPEHFGGSSGFTSAWAGQLHGRNGSNFTYSSLSGTGEIYATNPDEIFADLPVDIPDGARIEFLRSWFSDTNAAQNINVFLLEVCQPASGPGNQTTTNLGSVTSSGSGGNGSLSVAIDVPADSTSCIYLVRTAFGSGLSGGPADSTLRLQKVRVQWVRQVSPAPAVATFPNDVPTSHPFFKFVEALASAGITAGTGPGTFGVNDPITRGQMAVFLAFALGLDFGS